MKKSLLLLASLLTGLAQAQTFDFLDINQVKARVNSGGDLHFDPSTSSGSYECPIGSGKNYGGPASLWIGGVDVGGQLKLAGQTYRQGGVDFWPGPLDVTTATTNSTAVNQYNKVWKINKSDIDAFLINFANGNVQNGSYIIPNSILNWPGNGDISQNQDVLLAPFVDGDGDQIYSPTAGDYPLIKGDQAIFTVFNDNYLPHQATGGNPIGLEIRLMAYAYGPCSITISNPFLNYTTFYDYQIINRSSFALFNVHAGLFNDSDIGNYINDYVGSDVADHYAYTYNASSSPSNEPAIGIIQLQGPIETANGIDDDGDGITDESGEQMSMTGFSYFNNSFAGVPIAQTDPSNATEYYQYLSGFWRDGTPLTCGGNGYGGSTATPFAYTNNTYTNGACGNTNWTETGTGSDKKFVMSSGPYILQPGEVDHFEYAYIVAFDSTTNNPLVKLDADVQNLHSIYNSTLNQCLATSIKKQDINTASMSISPNPTNGALTISLNKTTPHVTIEVIDAIGKVLLSENHKEFNKTTINVSDLSSGIYFVKIISGENTVTKKFIKE